MVRAVLDSTVLVSTFLKPVSGGASFDILRMAGDGGFDLVLSRAILEETERVLRTSTRIRHRYLYEDAAVVLYCRSVAKVGKLVRKLPDIRVVRDPNDDMILATAVAARADFLVTRDRDLLTLDRYGGIAIVTPEAFLAKLR